MTTAGANAIKRDLHIGAIACLLGAIVCWGIPPVMLRYLALGRYVPDGYTTNLVRYPIATMLYLPLVIAAARRGGLGRFWVAALLPASVNIVGQTFFGIAPYYMPAGMMSFLVRVSVVWSILGAFWLFPDERRLVRSTLFWLGGALALGGFVLMSWFSGAAGEITVGGVVIILLCSVFWGLYDITVRYTMRKLDPLVVFGVIGNYSSVGLILLAPMGEPSSLLRLSPWHAVLLVVSAFIGITAAHGMYYVAIQRLGVAVSALTLMLTPFISLVGSSLFLGEHFSPVQWICGIMLIAGATLALWSRQRMLREPAEPVDLGPD